MKEKYCILVGAMLVCFTLVILFLAANEDDKLIQKCNEICKPYKISDCNNKFVVCEIPFKKNIK